MPTRAVKLADNTISAHEIDLLASWLKEGHQITKGPLTREFEAELDRKSVV
jgi:dTDP-4-amino-4,6-dideoxygalactose transaminase